MKDKPSNGYDKADNKKVEDAETPRSSKLDFFLVKLLSNLHSQMPTYSSTLGSLCNRFSFQFLFINFVCPVLTMSLEW